MTNQALISLATSIQQLQQAKANNKSNSLLDYIRKSGKQHLLAWAETRKII